MTGEERNAKHTNMLQKYGNFSFATLLKYEM